MQIMRKIALILCFTLLLLCSTAYGYVDSVTPAEDNTVEIAVVIDGAECKNPFVASYDGERLESYSVGEYNPTMRVSKEAVVKLFDIDPDSMQPGAEPVLLYAPATAENVSVSTVFSDHMVLQRERPVCVWGTSEDPDGRYVTVSLGDNHGYAEVKNGKWQAYLPPMEANKTPQTLTVSGKNTTISFEDVCVGDVYFVGGQSNSDYNFSRTDTYSADVANSANDSIRFFYQNRWDLYCDGGRPSSETIEFATTPQENPMAKGNYKWEIAGPDTVGKISAIGYYFADTVAEAIENEIPIGLVQVASGGSLLNHSSPVEINQKYDTLYNTTEFTTGDASYIYNSMIHPVEKYTARGMLWYQGESDSGSNLKISTYAERFEDLVSYLEGVNGNPWDVFYVQLSSHNGAINAAVAGWKVARFRAMQYNMQAEDRVMVVSMDHGVHKTDTDAAHPRYKKPVGQRLGAAALAKIYGVGALETAQSPMPESVTYTADGAQITFKNVQDGLKAYDGEAVVGFELTKDGVATPATATIQNANTIVLTGVENPTGVRYGYYIAAGLSAANLVNSADLPCPTFALGEGADEIEPLSVGILDGEIIDEITYDYTGKAAVLSADYANGAQLNADENWAGESAPESPNGAVSFKNMRGTPGAPSVYLMINADKSYTDVPLTLKYSSYDGTQYANTGSFVYSAPSVKVNGELVSLTTTTGPGKGWGYWTTQQVATVNLQAGLNKIPVEWVSGWTYIDQFVLGTGTAAFQYAGEIADISADYADGALLNSTQNWAGESRPESPNGAVDFMNMRGAPANPSVSVVVYADKAYTNVPLSLKYSSYDGTSYADRTGFVYSAPSVKVNGELVSLTTTTGPGKGWGYWTTQQVATVNLQPGLNKIPVEWVSGWTYIDQFVLGTGTAAFQYAGEIADISADYADGALLNSTQNWAGESRPESPNGAVDFMNMRGAPANPSVNLVVYADKAYTNVPLSLKYSSYDGTQYASQGFVYSAPSLNVNGELVSLTTTTGPGKGWGYWTTQQVATVTLQPGINKIPIDWVSGWTYIDRFILGAE